MATTAYTATARSLDVFYTKSYLNLRIADSSGTTLYYVNNSAFTPRKADVTLCRGSRKSDPVVGVVRWSHMYSKHFIIGVGDLARDERNTIWEEVRTDLIRHPEYKWALDTPDARRSFAWHRIHGAEAMLGGAGTNPFSFVNFKLVDCSSGEVVALFASTRLRSWKKLGKFTIHVDGQARGWGEKWEVMVLLSCLGLVEMSRRRGRQRRSCAVYF